MKKCKQCGFECSEFMAEQHFHKKKNSLESKCKKCVCTSRRAKALSDRITALQKYSDSYIPSCACCGITDIYFLQIDHINGGGAKHREELGEGGDRLVRWLKKNNYPTGFQVLCANCNWSKSSHGQCAHEAARKLKLAIHSGV